MPLRKPKVVRGTTLIKWCPVCDHNLRNLTACPVCKTPAQTRTVTLCIACEGSGWSTKKTPCHPCEGTGIKRR